ncbi:MAG: hypothetical protein O9264_15535 [Leptospira sp.]|nr:hypothetical protein [Leptospira sp.]
MSGVNRDEVLRLRRGRSFPCAELAEAGEAEQEAGVTSSDDAGETSGGEVSAPFV